MSFSEDNRQRWIRTDSVMTEIVNEREIQDIKWGEQNHPVVHPTYGDASHTYYHNEAQLWQVANAERVESGHLAWDGILLEEVYEALAESNPKKMRAELIQVAAVAVAMIECLDRSA